MVLTCPQQSEEQAAFYGCSGGENPVNLKFVCQKLIVEI